MSDLLETLNEKIDRDLSDALYEQKRLLEELHEERILALTPETLAMQQKLIRATRKLTEEMSNKVLYGISAITGEQNE